MAEPRLSVHSAKARDLAHRLARREHRSSPMSWSAPSKLMKFARRGASRHPLSMRALPNTYGSELDLDAVIRENRKIDPSPVL
jgi:hypothetical protein